MSTARAVSGADDDARAASRHRRASEHAAFMHTTSTNRNANRRLCCTNIHRTLHDCFWQSGIRHVRKCLFFILRARCARKRERARMKLRCYVTIMWDRQAQICRPRLWSYAIHHQSWLVPSWFDFCGYMSPALQTMTSLLAIDFLQLVSPVRWIYYDKHDVSIKDKGKQDHGVMIKSHRSDLKAYSLPHPSWYTLLSWRVKD